MADKFLFVKDDDTYQISDLELGVYRAEACGSGVSKVLGKQGNAFVLEVSEEAVRSWKKIDYLVNAPESYKSVRVKVYIAAYDYEWKDYFEKSPVENIVKVSGKASKLSDSLVELLDQLYDFEGESYSLWVKVRPVK